MTKFHTQMCCSNVWIYSPISILLLPRGYCFTQSEYYHFNVVAMSCRTTTQLVRRNVVHIKSHDVVGYFLTNVDTFHNVTIGKGCTLSDNSD